MRISLSKNLEPLRAVARSKIDTEAEEFRQQFLTPGSGQAMVYQAKQAEARQFFLDGTIGALMQAEIGVTANTAEELATLWLQMEQQWLQVAAHVEQKRLKAKIAVDDANSPLEIEQATQVVWSL